jgi:hypothetical protein
MAQDIYQYKLRADAAVGITFNIRVCKVIFETTYVTCHDENTGPPLNLRIQNA